MMDSVNGDSNKGMTTDSETNFCKVKIFLPKQIFPANKGS